MTLVAADAAHATAIAAMHRICFTEFWDERAVIEILRMPGSYGWILQTAEGQPQGLILCRTAADEAEVLTILVLPPWRRQGLGAILLEAGCETARRMGAVSMFLEAAQNNAAALELYQGHGFAEVGRRPRYYGGKTDALILRKDLRSAAA